MSREAESMYRCVLTLRHFLSLAVSALNHFVMLDLKARGFRAMNAGIGVPSVYRNWMNAPAGCRSYSYLDLNMLEIEIEDEDGRKVKPYKDSGMAKEGWLMWCDLNVESPESQ